MSYPETNGAEEDAGYVYLLHLSEPFSHCRHYIGFAHNVAGRLKHHQAGSGARLTAALNRAGIKYEVAAQWSGTRALERYMKKQKEAHVFCPKCRATPKNPEEMYQAHLLREAGKTLEPPGLTLPKLIPYDMEEIPF